MKMPRTALNELNVHVFYANNYAPRISDQAAFFNVKKYHSRDTGLMKDYIIERALRSQEIICACSKTTA